MFEAHLEGIGLGLLGQEGKAQEVTLLDIGFKTILRSQLISLRHIDCDGVAVIGYQIGGEG